MSCYFKCHTLFICLTQALCTEGGRNGNWTKSHTIYIFQTDPHCITTSNLMAGLHEHRQLPELCRSSANIRPGDAWGMVQFGPPAPLTGGRTPSTRLMRSSSTIAITNQRELIAFGVTSRNKNNISFVFGCLWSTQIIH